MTPRNHMVFVQTNDLQGNRIRVYHRADDGTLTLGHTVDTGGNGGHLQGAGSDPLASQGSLVFDPHHRLVFAVNAGSDTISVLNLEDGHLNLRQVLPSGGSFPVSLTVHRDLLYVLNAKEAGTIMGYRISGEEVHAIPESARSLGLTPASGPTQFVSTPAQVGFTSDGRRLVITTKANGGGRIQTFAVESDGRPSRSMTSNSAGTPIPFGFTFDWHGHLVVTDAGTSTLTTYRIHQDGTTEQLGSQADGQQAMCWVARADGGFYVADNGTNTITGFRIDAAGKPTVFTTAGTDDGPTDLATVSGGRFIYALAGGAGRVDGFRVEHDGSLTRIATVAGLDGAEGIAAS
jgi:6-phosphogluconolactonase (cycloisomerase 2 family)